MSRRIVIVGGGAAGIGAAGAAKGTDPTAEITVFTEYQDAAYSPCGIPYVHGKEIPDFERLFLGTKQQYADQGIDIRYETRVDSYDLGAKTVSVGGQQLPFDALVVGSGWNYGKPDVPGNELSGIYYMKNIREAMEWDKVLDTVKSAVVLEAGPLGLEMVTALAHRGIETHLVDPTPWALSMATDPDIAKPVEDSWVEMGVHLHFNTKLEEILGDENGAVRGVRTSDGDIPCQLLVVATHKVPNTDIGQAAGLKVGSAGGFIVDESMATSVPGVWAAGDCIEVPHGVSNVPVQGLSGSHAYAQGKVAGINAAGGQRAYQPVYVPWGMVAGKWMIGGVSFSETLATALGVPFVMGVAQGISRARYYPDMKPVKVKLLAEPGTLRLIGAQMVGGEGIKERADFLAMAVRTGITLRDLATMENVYSPPIGALNEPIALAAQNALSKL
ncbi:MAG: CoA-disulfide reductase [Frankiales bacterium]|nr:CoA-disulfide reductase [Frankiales bacterium]